MNALTEEQFMELVDGGDYKEIFSIFFNEVLLNFPKIYSRKEYFLENESECPIVIIPLDIVIIPEFGSYEILMAILGMYYQGKNIDGIPRYDNNFWSNYFLRGHGYCKLSRVEWSIAKSIKEKLDKYDYRILSNQSINWLNF